MTPTRSIQSLSLAMALVASPALAALPPDYQRAAELIAVIEAASEVMAGGGETIQSVNYLGVDTYEVSYEHCTLRVDIVGVSPKEGEIPMPGPRQFEAVAGEPDCEQ